MLDTSKLENKCDIITDLQHVLAIHGMLCLALRHPKLGKETRKRGKRTIKALEDLMLQEGLIDEETRKEIHQVEKQENPPDGIDL